MSYMKRHLIQLQEREAQRLAERNKHAKQRMEQQGLISGAPAEPAPRQSKDCSIQLYLDDLKFELDKELTRRDKELQTAVDNRYFGDHPRLTGNRPKLVIMDDVTPAGDSELQKLLLNADYSQLEQRMFGFWYGELIDLNGKTQIWAHKIPKKLNK